MTQAASRTETISRIEFIAMMAMIAAVVAFSIDAFLPAMGQIATELTPDAPNNVQWLITAFILGLGLGTFVAGAISDAYGRKVVMIGGVVLYVGGAIAAAYAPSLTTLLIGRAVMGLGAAGPRVVSMAMMRDLYSGRGMAQIMSWMMMIFSIVPAIAPTLGAGIISFWGWRGVFLAAVVFAALSALWLGLRQPETLRVEDRRPLRLSLIAAAIAEVFSHDTVRRSLIAQTLVFGMLFAVLASTQLVFDGMFGLGATFHYWFGGMAILASSASVINARLVVLLGMRAMVRAVLFFELGVSAAMILASLTLGVGTPLFVIYLVWTTTKFFVAGLTIGNLNALGLEPLGHIAGIAASVLMALATIGAVIISGGLAYFFDGTPLPLAIGTLACALAALAAMHGMQRDKG